MQVIKFNRNYKKLHNQKTALLVHIRIKTGKQLNEEFIKYDTDNKYKINKKQKYLILYLQGDKFIPFTTLRKFNKENIWKYSLMEKYKIVVEEQK